MRSNERFKTSPIVNARFRENYFKGRVCVSVHRATDLDKISSSNLQV